MSDRYFTLKIDRVVVGGSALGTVRLERIRDRVESELASAIRRASWPNESVDAASVRITGDTEPGADENAVADRVIAAVMEAVGSSPTGATRNG